MKKNLLLRLCLMIGVILTFYSCRTEDLSYQQKDFGNLSHNRKFYVLNGKEVKAIPDLWDKVQSIQQNSSGRKAAIKADQDSLLQDGVIDTDSVLVIENNGNRTYTFNIIKDAASPIIENLVLKKNEDETFSGVLMKYNFTVQEKQMAALGHSVNLTDRIEIFPIEKLNLSARVVSQISGCYRVVWETGLCAAGLHSYGEPCQLTGDERAGVPQVISVTNTCIVSTITEYTDGPPGSGGGGGFDTGVWGAGGYETEFVPCDQLKKLQNEPEFKSKMNILKSNVETGSKEKGFVLFDQSVPNSNHLPPNFRTSDIIEGDAKGDINYGPYLASLPNDEQYRRYGAAHNHLKNNPYHIGVFSPEDLGNLLLFGWIESAPTNPYGSLYAEKSVNFVITNIGLFAIKINDLSKLEAYMVKYGQKREIDELENYNKKEIQEKYKIMPTSSHDEQVIGLLRLINDEQIGIDFYEGNPENYNNWKKLELVNNGNNTFSYNEVPCDL